VPLSHLDPAARADVLARAKNVLGQLAPQDFLWEGEVVCAVATNLVAAGHRGTGNRWRNLDGPSIACDDTVSSRHYGNCYVEFTRLDRPEDSAGKVIQMPVSADGGNTWGAAKTTGNQATATAGNRWYRPTTPWSC
jgi:hypothetical protein